MKILISILIVLSTSTVFAQAGTYYCSLTSHKELRSVVYQTVTDSLSDQGVVQMPDSGAELSNKLWELVDPPVVYSVNTFGDGTESWHTDIVVYPMKKSFLDQGLFYNRTLAFKVTYTKFYVDGDDGLFGCIENRRLSEEVIGSIEKIEWLK